MKNWFNKIGEVGILTIALMGMVACQGLKTKDEKGWSLQSRESCCGGVSTFKVRNVWTPNSVGLVDKHFDGNWEFKSLVEGDGTILRLEERGVATKEMKFSTAAPHYETVVIQLPESLEVGKTYPLKAVSKNRRGVRVVEDTEIAVMRPGDVTAFQFFSPILSWLGEDNLAEAVVTVHSLTSTEMAIDLTLVSKSSAEFQIKIRRRYVFQKGTGE